MICCSERGYDVASVKKTDHSIMLDTPGKDTYRHGQAGASPVVFSSSLETTYIIHRSLSEQQIIDHLGSFGDIDVILIEGCTDDSIKKVSMDETSQLRKNTIFFYPQDKENIKTYLLDELTRRM
jgi:molybdopterin-guanine dinucleotide biosynthesis protein B